MPNWLYFTLWLLLALLLAAFASAAIAKHLKHKAVRREQALLMLDALERYSEWVAAQRYAPIFEGESNEAADALDEASTLRMGWFPELALDMAHLLAIHARLLTFLSIQHGLRQRDPDAWIETDHDGRFLALWRQLHMVMQRLQKKLLYLGTVSPEALAMPVLPQSPAAGSSKTTQFTEAGA